MQPAVMIACSLAVMLTRAEPDPDRVLHPHLASTKKLDWCPRRHSHARHGFADISCSRLAATREPVPARLQCGMAIEKRGGCKYMLCPRNAGGCGHEFCWLCRCVLRTSYRLFACASDKHGAAGRVILQDTAPMCSMRCCLSQLSHGDGASNHTRRSSVKPSWQTSCDFHQRELTAFHRRIEIVSLLRAGAS